MWWFRMFRFILLLMLLVGSHWCPCGYGKTSKKNQSATDRVIQKNMSKFVGCYKKIYPKPQSKGAVTLAVRINSGGIATKAKLVEYTFPIKSPKLVQCLKKVIYSLEYPAIERYSPGFSGRYQFSTQTSKTLIHLNFGD